MKSKFKEECMAKLINIFLDEILTTIRKISELLKDKTLDDFKSNYHVVENVIKYLNIISEAARHVPDEVKQEFSGIPWEELINLRNIENNPEHLNLVWNIATNKLTEISAIIEEVLN